MAPYITLSHHVVDHLRQANITGEMVKQIDMCTCRSGRHRISDSGMETPDNHARAKERRGRAAATGFSPDAAAHQRRTVAEVFSPQLPHAHPKRTIDLRIQKETSLFDMRI